MDHVDFNRGVPVRKLSVYDPRIKIRKLLIWTESIFCVFTAFFLFYMFVWWVEEPIIGWILLFSFLIASYFSFILLDHALGLGGKEIIIYSNGVQFPTTRFSRLFHARTFVDKASIDKVVVKAISPTQYGSRARGLEPTGYIILVGKNTGFNTSDRKYSELTATAEWMAKEWRVPVEGLEDMERRPAAHKVAKANPTLSPDAFCTECGSRLNPEDSFCNACGKPIERS